MESQPEVFADGMGEITLSGGMVRIDLVSLSSSRKDSEGNPQLEFRQRIVMPPDGFLRCFSAMEDLVKKLVDAGLVKPRGNEATPTTHVEQPDPPKSPNF